MNIMMAWMTPFSLHFARCTDSPCRIEHVKIQCLKDDSSLARTSRWMDSNSGSLAQRASDTTDWKVGLTHRSFYAQKLLHTEAFTHRLLYTQTLLHTDAFTYRPFYTQTLLHTEAFTHRSFYTQTLLHTDPFTRRPFYTQKLLHTNTFTHRDRTREIAILLSTSVFDVQHPFRAKGLRWAK